MDVCFGGNIAVMDIYAAQHMFGRGRSFDRDVHHDRVDGRNRSRAELRARIG